jgi:hypothetical protein
MEIDMASIPNILLICYHKVVCQEIFSKNKSYLVVMLNTTR